MHVSVEHMGELAGVVDTEEGLDLPGPGGEVDMGLADEDGDPSAEAPAEVVAGDTDDGDADKDG